MALFEWKQEYSVGVKVLDQHHQKLIGIVNRVHMAMKEGKGKELIADTIRDLIDYTTYHFGEEEKLMEQAEYPELIKHKKAHKEFVSRLEAYKGKADKGQSAFLSPDVARFLIDWLINHIGLMDKKYQSALNSKGIR